MINDVITNGWKTLRALGESEGLEGNPYFMLRTIRQIDNYHSIWRKRNMKE